jgi:hypothetical protein
MRRFSPWVHGVDKPQYGNFIGFFDLNYNSKLYAIKTQKLGMLSAK